MRPTIQMRNLFLLCDIFILLLTITLYIAYEAIQHLPGSMPGPAGSIVEQHRSIHRASIDPEVTQMTLFLFIPIKYFDRGFACPPYKVLWQAGLPVNNLF